MVMTLPYPLSIADGSSAFCRRLREARFYDDSFGQ